MPNSSKLITEQSVSDQIFLDRFNALNPQQKQAVETLEGPVLVVAGPGSGKTELLSLRVANILRMTDTLPSSILCLTFTDSASVNMQKRLESLIGPEAYKVAVHTFHSFGREVIAQNPEYFYQGASYAPADEIQQLEILKEIFESLPHTNTLDIKNPEHGYTYIKDAKSRIGELKKGGLNPDEFQKILEIDKNFIDQAAPLLSQVFEGRIDKSIIAKTEDFIKKLAALKVSAVAPPLHSKSLQQKIVESLGAALLQTEESGTKPITEWKNTYTKKDDQKRTVFKDADRLQKNFDLVGVYQQYLKKLRERGLFDYDDMLLDVAHALQKHNDLRFTLQEKFLYILVDEFQDTNGVQMRLLDLLLDSELNEGRPNIMAVGDDDQSIYKFQGANVENILGFHKKFRDPAIVVLTNNYRSTQEILDFARKVILQGDDRLENRLENVQKDLVASRQHLPRGMLMQKDFETSYHELFWVAEQLKKIIEENRCRPSEIAVLAPKHKILETAAKALNYFGIPVSYEREQNLLDDPLISEIVTILSYIDSTLRNDQEQAEHLLPVILSFKFWNINRVTLWKIATTALKARPRKNWLDVMLGWESVSIRNIAKFLIDLSAEAKEKTVEEIIDRITGVEPTDIPNDEYMDEDQPALGFDQKENFKSPFKSYYFSEENFSDPKSRYFEYLENLQSFIAKIRQYKSSKTLFTADVLRFIQLLDDNDLPLHHTLKFSTNDDAVQLMTVHKAKGLEFDSVFVLNCQDNAWIRRNGDKLQFPSNLPLSAENETPDDVLRKFYVAATRAKYHLYLTWHHFDDKGREQVYLRFLSTANQLERAKKTGESINMDEVKSELAKDYKAENFFLMMDEVRRHEPYSEDEKHLLKNILKNYKLNATNLKNFLDVVRAGPHVFLEKNLLRFPQMMSPNAAFGTAMHKALANFYLSYKLHKKMPSLDFLQKEFQEALELHRLNSSDYKKRLDQGKADLKCFYENRSAVIDPQDKVEVSFHASPVTVEGVPLSGAVDRLHLESGSNEATVFDYKTGKILDGWESSDQYQQLKAWEYKLQLVFYKILIENSREFRGKIVRKGVIDFLKPKNNQIVSLEHEITDEEVVQLKKLIGIVYQKIMNLDFPDVSKYDQDLFGIGCFIQDLMEGKI